MRFSCFLLLLVLTFGPQKTLAQVPVTVQTLGELQIGLQRSTPAEVLPLNEAQLAAEVTAVVAEINADVGDRVQAGDVLLQLDDRDYQLQLQQAEAMLASSEAQLAEAQAKLDRAEGLSQAQYLSADELLERRTALAVAKAQIQGDRIRVAVASRAVEKCRVLAPFDGVVASRSAQRGSFVAPGTALVRVVQTDRFELRAEVPVNIASSLNAERDLKFHSREESWSVRLLQLSAVIDPLRRTRSARLGFAGAAPEVGRSGDLVWTVEQGLPSHLLSRRDGMLGVFILDGSKAQFLPLENAQEGRPVLLENLPLDTLIIVQGRDKLQDGVPVTIP